MEAPIGIRRSGVGPWIHAHRHIPAVVDIYIRVSPVVVDVGIIPVSGVDVAGVGVISLPVSCVDIACSGAWLLAVT